MLHPVVLADLLDDEVAAAGVHPVTGEPFACVRGTWEYYLHTSHHQERWDAHRPRLRLADLLDHLLRKAGQ